VLDTTLDKMTRQTPGIIANGSQRSRYRLPMRDISSTVICKITRAYSLKPAI
jgi:hypothetical protein